MVGVHERFCAWKSIYSKLLRHCSFHPIALIFGYHAPVIGSSREMEREGQLRIYDILARTPRQSCLWESLDCRALRYLILEFIKAYQRIGGI